MKGRAKSAREIALAILLSTSLANVALSDSKSGSRLTAADIMKKSLDTYAALTCYSDTGKTVESYGGQTVTTTFSLRVQRPNLFRVLWTQRGANYTNEGSWWCDGKNTNRFPWLRNGETNMVVGYDTYFISGPAGGQTNTRPMVVRMPPVLEVEDKTIGYATMVPEILLRFDLHTNNIPTAPRFGHPSMELSHGKIGDEDCHLISVSFKSSSLPKVRSPDMVSRLWIGKRDYLLHQIQVTSKIAPAKSSKLSARSARSQEFSITQTHDHIVLNQAFSVADFEQKLPEYHSSITLHSAPPPTFHTPTQSVPAIESRTDDPNLTVLSAEFGMGENTADVTARVAELLRTQPEGFAVNAHTLGVDPLPGKKKRLVISYDYEGTEHRLVVQAGKHLRQGALVNNALK